MSHFKVLRDDIGDDCRSANFVYSEDVFGGVLLLDRPSAPMQVQGSRPDVCGVEQVELTLPLYLQMPG